MNHAGRLCQPVPDEGSVSRLPAWCCLGVGRACQFQPGSALTRRCKRPKACRLRVATACSVPAPAVFRSFALRIFGRLSLAVTRRLSGRELGARALDLMPFRRGLDSSTALGPRRASSRAGLGARGTGAASAGLARVTRRCRRQRAARSCFACGFLFLCFVSWLCLKPTAPERQPLHGSLAGTLGANQQRRLGLSGCRRLTGAASAGPLFKLLQGR